MGLRIGRGMIDPRYYRHPMLGLEGDYTSLIDIIRPRGGAEQTWVEAEERWTNVDVEPMWRGMARVQPNKDWRARNRTWASEQTAEHAVRFQFNLAKNHLVPKSEWPAPLVDIQHGDIVRVQSNPNDPVLELYQFTVRNPIGASDNWHRTILCDANLGGRYDTGP